MILNATLSQMAFLFGLIALGYILAKFNFIPQNAEATLSKLESYLLIPALILGTFISNFTVDKIKSASSIMLVSLVIELIVIPISILISKFLAKDAYTRKIYTYGLSFSNFGFMGNAVVSALFPEVFLDYILFTLVLWIFIYLWGTPTLLMDSGEGKRGVFARLRTLVHPMFISMLAGIVIGLSSIKLPAFATSLISSLGGCMSPVAMLLTGITIARFNILELLKIKSIYIVSLLRLLVYPAVFIVIARVCHFESNIALCAVASLAMPLGLSTIVIPASYGKDTKVGSGMALISHLLSCLTIPLVFLLFNF